MRLLCKMILRALYYLDSETAYRMVRFFSKKRLSKLLLHINTTCNYDCRYCYVDKSKKALSFDDWMRCIREAKRIGVTKVSLLGGEPLCEPKLFDLVKSIHLLGMKPYIYTNGSLITEEWVVRMLPFKPVLVFKYDKDTPTYHYHTQQERYTLEHIDQTIRLCRGKGLRVITFTTLLRRNVGAVEDIFERSLSAGALPAFERYLPVKDDSRNNMLEITDAENAAAMDIVTRKLHAVKREWIAAIRIAGRSCGCYSDILSVMPSGAVLPCPYLPEEASLGNVCEASLQELFRRLRERMNAEYKLPDTCVRCTYKYECAGGCFTYAYLKERKFVRHCKKGASIGFCSYMLVDLYDGTEAVR